MSRSLRRSLRPSVRRVATALAGSVALAVATSIPGTTSVPDGAAPPTVDVVNLGDSFSAGIGAGELVESEVLPDCVQGEGPHHVDQLTSTDGANLLLDAACGGLTTEQIATVAQSPRVAAALDEAELVTLTLGGNDVRYMDYVQTCSWFGDAQRCDEMLAQAPSLIAQAGASATETLATIDTATDGQIVVLGYPHLFDGGRDNAWLSAERVAQIDRYTDELNAALADAAAVNGVTFVDVTERFAGHGADSSRSWMYFNPESTSDVNNLHPNERGYLSGYYPALRDALCGMDELAR